MEMHKVREVLVHEFDIETDIKSLLKEINNIYNRHGADVRFEKQEDPFTGDTEIVVYTLRDETMEERHRRIRLRQNLRG